MTNSSIVGILINENFRGSGLASIFLLDSDGLYFSENKLPVMANIKEQNTASVKSFEKAKDRLFKEELVHGSNSFAHKLEMRDLYKDFFW